MQVSEAYSAEAFHTLASLEDASKYFNARNGLSTVEEKLRPLILKYDVARLFGVALVHRHFDLAEGTMLVEKDLQTTPWHVGNSFEKHCGKIVPMSWFHKDGKTYPYEFSFVPFDKKAPSELQDYASFVQEFFDVVKDNGLEKSVGLRRLFGHESTGMLECTEGNANIMFLSHEIPPEYLNGTDTMWFFDGQPPYRMYRCACRDTGAPGRPSHFHIDGA